ncbi:transcription factor stalky-like [Sitodiplosis mosellana]|uniref:transcription factor stalky-like n=1 Tax=Sitodiplosis mosellana TaxID=263140 RepID=UPI0024451A2D|nr:transcription factor stalky-like [Sitodiplosis mosellana]
MSESQLRNGKSYSSSVNIMNVDQTNNGNGNETVEGVVDADSVNIDDQTNNGNGNETVEGVVDADSVITDDQTNNGNGNGAVVVDADRVITDDQTNNGDDTEATEGTLKTAMNVTKRSMLETFNLVNTKLGEMEKEIEALKNKNKTLEKEVEKIPDLQKQIDDIPNLLKIEIEKLKRKCDGCEKIHESGGKEKFFTPTCIEKRIDQDNQEAKRQRRLVFGSPRG